MTYAEQIQHPKWQMRRLEILKRDEGACQLCKDEATTLHIHHKYYTKGALIWEYPDEALQTLCKHCHAIVEQMKKASSLNIAFHKIYYKEKNMHLVCAYFLDNDKQPAVGFYDIPANGEPIFRYGLLEQSMKNVLDNMKFCKTLIKKPRKSAKCH